MPHQNGMTLATNEWYFGKIRLSDKTVYVGFAEKLQGHALNMPCRFVRQTPSAAFIPCSIGKPWFRLQNNFPPQTIRFKNAI